jgi:hypothetical protein
MPTHSSSLAWEIPWTEEHDGLHGPWGRKESAETEPPFPQIILGDIYHILSEMLLVFTNSFPRGFLTISMG